MWKGGRPAKLNEVRLAKAEEVLSNGNNIVCLTDEDLCAEINEGLDEEYQINKRTFERYKAGEPIKDPSTQQLLQKFCRLIEKGLREQKKNLLVKMTEENQNWTKRARIIERKFDEWNIRHKQEVVTKDESDQLTPEEMDKIDQLLQQANSWTKES